MRKSLLFILGTRPEALKLAPLIVLAKRDPKFKTLVCLTAQHREMADQVMNFFNLKADFDLNLMSSGQSLEELTRRLLDGLGPVFDGARPDLVLVQGDTTTAFVAALKAFYQKIKIAHIEAGLRSHDKYQPFPEEINRVMISRLADFHFAPTPQAAENLLAEGVARKSVFCVGNTVVDALSRMGSQFKFAKTPRLPASFVGKRLILMTAHRRENFGAPLKSICAAIERLCRAFPDVRVVYPVHLNPQVQKIVYPALSGNPSVHLLPPLSYSEFMALMIKSTLIVTDSGGVQEEAPSFGKPVFVMRETTERPEGVRIGISRLVGTSENKIFREVSEVLLRKDAYRKMTVRKNPYGDGRSSQRILKILRLVLKS